MNNCEYMNNSNIPLSLSSSDSNIIRFLLYIVKYFDNSLSYFVSKV